MDTQFYFFKAFPYWGRNNNNNDSYLRQTLSQYILRTVHLIFTTSPQSRFYYLSLMMNNQRSERFTVSNIINLISDRFTI